MKYIQNKYNAPTNGDLMPCLKLKTHLTERTQVKAIWLGISRTCIHVISQQQDELQQLAEGMALPDFITGGVNSHDIRTQVIHLLLKLYPEEDVAEARTQPLHAAHLQVEHREKNKKYGKRESWKRKWIEKKELGHKQSFEKVQ